MQPTIYRFLQNSSMTSEVYQMSHVFSPINASTRSCGNQGKLLAGPRWRDHCDEPSAHGCAQMQFQNGREQQSNQRIVPHLPPSQVLIVRPRLGRWRETFLPELACLAEDTGACFILERSQQREDAHQGLSCWESFNELTRPLTSSPPFCRSRRWDLSFSCR